MGNISIGITGEYSIAITYNTMFMNKTITLKNHNLITKKGMEWFIKKWHNNNVGEIKSIRLGKNTAPNSSLYSLNDFIEPYTFNVAVHSKTETAYSEALDEYVDKGLLILSQNSLQGKNFNETTEIGVIATDEQGEDVLLSRTRYDSINIPDSCIINMEYHYILENKTTE